MSTEAEKIKMPSDTTALTERLRRAATVSDAGPRQQAEQETQADAAERDVILELNQAIQEIIEEAPLKQPAERVETPQTVPPSTAVQPPPQSQQSSPQLQSWASGDTAAAQETRYLVSGPDGTLHSGIPTAPYQTSREPSQQSSYSPATAEYLPATVAPPVAPGDDEGDLQQWLARHSDEQHETRSRARVVALCAVTMILSILAGYGSAQLLNGFRTDDDAKPVPIVRVAEAPSNVLVIDQDEPASDDMNKLVKRVTKSPISSPEEAGSTQPAETAEDPLRQPYRVASLSDFSGALSSVTQKFKGSQNQMDPKKAPDALSVVAPELPPTDPDLAKPSGISEADIDHLLKRAHSLIDNRDIAAARLVLRHLAEAGHGPAARELAQTYDSEWLSANGAAEVRSNDDMALRWYSMALERGELGFEKRIDALEKIVRVTD